MIEVKGKKLAELGAGSHFGEMGLVDDAPRSATVRTLEDSRILKFGPNEIFGLMRRDTALAHSDGTEK